MKVGVRKIKIFRIKNRKGFAAICQDHLTEGRTLQQTYARMLKALRRSKIEVSGLLDNPKSLLRSLG